MSDTELKQLENLRRDLDTAQQENQDTRTFLHHSNCEARLYRSLFWALLAVLAIAMIVSLLRP